MDFADITAPYPLVKFRVLNAPQWQARAAKVSYFTRNLARFARELRNERPSHIPALLAAAAGVKLRKAGETMLYSTGVGGLITARYRGPGVVLMFHEIHDDVDAELRTGCSPDQLRNVLEALRREKRAVVTADEALLRIGNPERTEPFALLTFDDGYRDNCQKALPILEQYSAPMTMFVPTGMVTRDIHAWWLGLRHLFKHHDRVEIEAMNRSFDCADGPSKNAAMRHVTLWVGTDRNRAEALKQTFSRYALSMSDLVAPVAMDDKELRRFAEHPLVTIGGHTTTHTFLSGLDDEAAFRDIADNKLFLENLLGRPVRHFAYPYGTAGACGVREAEYVRRAGFASGFSTRPGQLFPQHLDAPFLLPREDVGFANMSGAQLAGRLSGARRALETRFGDPVAGVA